MGFEKKGSVNEGLFFLTQVRLYHHGLVQCICYCGWNPSLWFIFCSILQSLTNKNLKYLNSSAATIHPQPINNIPPFLGWKPWPQTCRSWLKSWLLYLVGSCSRACRRSWLEYTNRITSSAKKTEMILNEVRSQNRFYHSMFHICLIQFLFYYILVSQFDTRTFTKHHANKVHKITFILIFQWKHGIFHVHNKSFCFCLY